MTIKQLVKISHDWAVSKGFWDYKCDDCGYDYLSPIHLKKTICPKCGEGNTSYRNDGEMIALMHSELSEALEELRKPKIDKNKLGKEFADVLIRIADYCGGRGIDLQKHVIEKMEINKKRPYKHGKTF